MGNDDHVVDAFEGGEGLASERVVEIGASRSFVDEFGCGYCDYEEVAEVFGFFEVYDVPRVNEVECAVALDDALAGLFAFFE